MDFCERCGGVILLQEDKAACASCGYRPKKKIKLEASEKIEKRETIAVIKEGQSNIYPIVQIKCPKCDSNKAYFWTTQTRSSDESETKFYKCVKCNHTWRVYR
ncbi:transcription factor S [Candidatus Pacearchaeota archaeon]|nr:transcription factor S [Candidatus Pacearchaeota archaeon]